MATGFPLPPQKRADIIATLQEGGRSVREVAALHGVSKTVVSKIASREVPDAFDRTHTEKAAQAQQVDGKKRRAALRERLLDEASAALDGLHQPYLVYSFGGRENSYNEHILEKPPAEVARNMVTTAAICIDKHAALEKIDSTAGSEEAISMLGKLADGFAAVHRERQEAQGAGQPPDVAETGRVDRDE